jgi:hypothetical protein
MNLGDWIDPDPSIVYALNEAHFMNFILAATRDQRMTGVRHTSFALELNSTICPNPS